MNILPKINYLFSVIPIFPPQGWFSSLNSVINKFYWKGKQVRIKLSTLQKPKQYGGLGAPNFLYYFLSTQLQHIRQWLLNYNSAHLDIARTMVGQLSLEHLPFIDKSVNKEPYFKLPSINSTLTAWWKANQILGVNSFPSCSTPIWHNPMFKMNKSTICFHTWVERGITTLGHLCNNGALMAFDLIKHTYQIPDRCLFQYIQLQHLIKQKTSLTNLPENSSPLLPKLKSLKPIKLLSEIYKIFSHHDKSITLPTVKWITDLHAEQQTLDWPLICNNNFTMFQNTKLQLIQYKILHRIHITKHKKHIMGLTDNNTCTHCPTKIEDHYHALWLCTPVTQFWSEIMRILSRILHLSILPVPAVCLLGDLSSLSLPTQSHKFLLIAITLAKKTILTNWKDKTKISLNHWLNLLSNHCTLEKLTATLKNTTASFETTWSEFLAFIQTQS